MCMKVWKEGREKNTGFKSVSFVYISLLKNELKKEI